MKNSILILFLIFFTLPSFADTFVVDGIRYKTNWDDETTVFVSSNDPKYEGDIVIPASVTYEGKTYGVTSIGNEAFRGCSGLTSITIPESVTSIGGWAFYGCSGLTSITIPSSVTSIGSSAFRNCSGLTSINIPDGVTSIEDYAFERCSGLTSVTIPSSVTSIGSLAFYGCSGLTSITIPAGVTSIGSSAFSGCSSLTSINIPDGVTSIVYGTFMNCSGLTSITIPDGVTSIGEWAFYDCSGLTSITIPAGVTSIGNSAFSGCSGLTSITIPSSVTSIESGTFSGCSGLTSINIPDGVTSIGDYAFAWCSGLTSITIPDGVTSIGSSAFRNCSGLTSINIPDGVTSIGEWAFYDCSGLTSVTIPDGVTSIGDYAFAWCSGLTSITIPDGVTSIGYETFYRCSSLTSINIPDGVTSIGSDAFAWCSDLKQVVTDNANVSMVKSALGTDKTYIVPCTLYDQYVAAGLTTTKHHDLVKTEAVAVTCTTDGNIEYYTCNDCSKHFSDAEALTEIAENSWVITALGHEWGSWSTTKEATCVAKGSKQRICTHDASHVDEADIAINSNNHTNVVTDEAIAATCTETGLTEGSHCEACHATIVAQTATEAIGHEWGSWSTTKEATCVEKGSQQRVCAHDASHVDVEDIDSNNHTNIVTDNAVAATCTEAGLTEGSHCEACHATIVAQETTEAIGHLFTEYIYNNDATTAADGTETAHCDHNCGATDSRTAEGTKLIPTGIGQVSGNSQKVIKTIEDGQIVIIRDGKKYDISGREL